MIRSRRRSRWRGRRSRRCSSTLAPVQYPVDNRTQTQQKWPQGSGQHNISIFLLLKPSLTILIMRHTEVFTKEIMNDLVLTTLFTTFKYYLHRIRHFQGLQNVSLKDMFSISWNVHKMNISRLSRSDLLVTASWYLGRLLLHCTIH